MFDWLPAFLDPPAARLIAEIAAGSILLGLVALAVAMFKYAKVMRWARTGGRIIASEPGFEIRQRFDTEAPRNERVAKIAYEFEVRGRKFRSGRILDSGHPPEDQTERLLRQYPKGAAVIVRYDPDDPSQSALETDHPPKDLPMGCLAATGIVLFFAAIGIWLVNSGFGQLAAWFPKALLPVMLPAVVLGVIFTIGFVVAIRRAAELHRWPQTPGRIVQSGTRQFQIRRDKARRTSRGLQRMQTAYMPVVEYTYAVRGQLLSNRSVWADAEVSGSQKYAQGIARKYPVGTDVSVRYDPADPKRSALEIGGIGHWLFLAGAVVAWGAAAATSGLFC